jgi:ABC-2 type transport system ATP-binding protein
MNNEYAIEAHDLTRKFGHFTAVDKISFTVGKGEIFGFLGANGAGKTTAMRMLCGLLSPSSGQASVAGFDIEKQSEKVKMNIGYMSQRFSLYEDLTVWENMRFYGGIYGLKNAEIKAKADEVMERLEIKSERNKQVKSLPLGWKQKLAFSTALIHDPKVVFLDEPTSGVDPITRRQFWELIYETANKGIAILITTHYLDEAEYCNRMSIMVDGKIAALGSPSELKTQFKTKHIDEVFIKLTRSS